jgi:tripartite-type tricarboxylate transporter receptor subunit TctC
MDRRQTLLGLLASGALGARGAAAQEAFPQRPITLANGYPPGGSTDVAARLLADAAAGHLGAGAKMIIENRPGASGTVAADWLQRQSADGYTLLLSESSSFAIWPSMHVTGTRYRPLEDFTWVAMVCTAPMVLIVSPEFPAKTVAEALDVLKSPRSDDLAYSSSGAGSIPHIGAELLVHTLGAGAKSRHIPYRGGAPAVLAVAKNETAWGVASLGSAAGLMEGGLVRPLAVTSPTRFPTFPDVPTFAEGGLPEMTLEIFYLVHAPTGVPASVLDKLNAACAAGLTNATLREKFLKAGMRAWEGPNTPGTTRKIVEDELSRFKRVSERTGIKIQGG